MRVPWYLMAKGKGGGYKAASGPIVSISDALAAPLRSLRVGIDPVQAGTGDPSPDNVRPISGWSEVNVWRTGKNLLDVDKYGQTLPRTQNGITWSKVSDGVYHASGTATGNSYFNLSFYSEPQSAMPCISFRGQRITLSSTDVHIKPAIAYFAKDGSFTQLSNGGIIPDNAVGLRAYVRIEKDTAIDTDFSVQLELGSTATPYEPYSGNQFTIQLGQTVYGGTLDVLSGVLTVDRAMVDLGTLNWSYNTTYAFFTSGSLANRAKGVTNLKSDLFKTTAGSWSGTPLQNAIWGNGSNTTIYVQIPPYDNVADFVQLVAGHQLVYELATPIEITLTPTEISTLQGQNTLWADTGDVTVEYLSAGGANPDLMKLAVAFMGRK